MVFLVSSCIIFILIWAIQRAAIYMYLEIVYSSHDHSDDAVMM